MAHVQFVRIKKLSGGGKILVAARHNLREIQAELGADSHIDPTRTPLNIVLCGASNAAKVAAEADKLLAAAKLTKPLRKDAVRGLELVASLPATSPLDKQAYFADVVRWAERFFEVPILSAVIHLDEDEPHCHVLMLPLFDGRMIGSALVGSKARLIAMQADFFEQVGQPYGLARKGPSKRFGATYRRKAADKVAGYLRRNPKSLNEPTILDALRHVFAEASNPDLMLEALGLEVP